MTSLLKQNSELREDGIWNWTLPAWVTRLPDGRSVNVCPSAGACKDLCYARNGTYRFPEVLAAHQRNLALTLDRLDRFKFSMISELAASKFRPTRRSRFDDDRDRLDLDAWTLKWADNGGIAVRIHDSGDFYSDEYLLAWIDIAERVTDVLFYAYTKEIKRVRRITDERSLPANLKITYSLGGVDDHLLDLEHDRHAEVFPSLDDLNAAGYTDQTENDLYCVLLTTPRVGIPANNIKHFKKRMGSSTFGSLEREKERANR